MKRLHKTMLVVALFAFAGSIVAGKAGITFAVPPPPMSQMNETTIRNTVGEQQEMESTTAKKQPKKRNEWEFESRIQNPSYK